MKHSNTAAFLLTLALTIANCSTETKAEYIKTIVPHKTELVSFNDFIEDVKNRNIVSIIDNGSFVVGFYVSPDRSTRKQTEIDTNKRKILISISIEKHIPYHIQE